MSTDDNFKSSNVHKKPVIEIIEKIIKNGCVSIKYKFFYPMAWRGDYYYYHPENFVIEDCVGECEKSAMEDIYTFIMSILVWEQRKAHDKINNLISPFNPEENIEDNN